MVKIIYRTLILLLSVSLLGCESKGPYDISEDKMLLDLSSEITTLEEELNKMITGLKEVKKVFKEPDLDSELKASIQTEIFQTRAWEKKMFEQIAYFKIKRRRRKASLEKRQKRGIDLHEVANKEVKEYFLHKKLYPLKKGWENRHRAAIEL